MVSPAPIFQTFGNPGENKTLPACNSDGNAQQNICTLTAISMTTLNYHL